MIITVEHRIPMKEAYEKSFKDLTSEVSNALADKLLEEIMPLGTVNTTVDSQNGDFVSAFSINVVRSEPSVLTFGEGGALIDET